MVRRLLDAYGFHCRRINSLIRKSMFHAMELGSVNLMRNGFGVYSDGPLEYWPEFQLTGEFRWFNSFPITAKSL